MLKMMNKVLTTIYELKDEILYDDAHLCPQSYSYSTGKDIDMDNLDINLNENDDISDMYDSIEDTQHDNTYYIQTDLAREQKYFKQLSLIAEILRHVHYYFQDNIPIFVFKHYTIYGRGMIVYNHLNTNNSTYNKMNGNINSIYDYLIKYK